MNPPAPHPHDRALLRPLASLGKPKPESGVSFLRRTEYISSHTSKVGSHSTTSKSLAAGIASKVKKPQRFNVDKESPEYVKQEVERSFQIAAEALKDSSRIKHPSKRNVRVLESYPLLPDMDAFPDVGGYISLKFQVNPVPPANVYDTRLDSAILRPVPQDEEKQRLRQEAIDAHERDPSRFPMPEPYQDLEFFLPDTKEDAANFKRKYDLMNPDRDNEDLYTYTVEEEDKKCFRFKRIRTYETAIQVQDAFAKYDEEVVLAIHDGSDGIRPRAAFYYPLVERSAIRPQRKRNIDRLRWGDAPQDAEQTVDIIDVTVRDAGEEVQARRRVWVDDPFHVDDEEEEAEGQPAGNEDGHHDEEQGGTQDSAGAEGREDDADHESE